MEMKFSYWKIRIHNQGILLHKQFKMPFRRHHLCKTLLVKKYLKTANRSDSLIKTSKSALSLSNRSYLWDKALKVKLDKDSKSLFLCVEGQVKSTNNIPQDDLLALELERDFNQQKMTLELQKVHLQNSFKYKTTQSTSPKTWEINSITMTN